MEVYEYAEYITRTWLIEREGVEYKINFAERDIYDDWQIIDEDGDELDIESETAQEIIEFCEKQVKKR